MSLIHEIRRGSSWAGSSDWYERRLRKSIYDKEKIDWGSFKEFLSRNCNNRTVKDRMRYARKYCDCLLRNDFSLLTTFSNAKRNHTLKSLSGLAKFLGLYQTFKIMMKSYGLTWKTANSEDLIISRLENSRKNSDVIKWITKVKEERPELDLFLDLVLISGLRFNESAKAYNLIIDLTEEDKLKEYYDFGKETLEHFRFK